MRAAPASGPPAAGIEHSQKSNFKDERMDGRLGVVWCLVQHTRKTSQKIADDMKAMPGVMENWLITF